MATLDAVSPTCLKAVHEFDFEKTNPGLSGKFVLKHLCLYGWTPWRGIILCYSVNKVSCEFAEVDDLCFSGGAV